MFDSHTIHDMQIAVEIWFYFIVLNMILIFGDVFHIWDNQSHLFVKEGNFFNFFLSCWDLPNHDTS
jgi:hypothetical protein